MLSRFLKTFLPILLLSFVSEANATITLVQTPAHGSLDNSSAGTAVTATFASTTAGNTLLAFCGTSTGSVNPITPSIVDTTNTVPLTSARVQYSSAGHGWGQNVAYESNIPGGAVTISCKSIVAKWDILIVAEYSGLDPRFPIDIVAVNGSSVGSGSGGTTRNSGSITTTQAHEVLVSFYYDDTPPSNVGVANNGFTVEDHLASDPTNGVSGAFADKIVSTIQTGTSVDWTGMATNDGTVITIVGLREAFSTVPPITLIQKTGATETGNTSIAKAFASNNISGNTILVGCDDTVSSSTITPSDTRGNSYTLIDSLTSGGSIRVGLWYALNIAAGANTVTCAYSGSENGLIAIFEYSGISALDQHAASLGNNGGVAPPTSNTSITTTSANELVFSFNKTNEVTYANDGPGNFTFRFYQATGSGSDYFYAYDQYVTATATFTNYWNTPAGAPNFMFTASFIQAPGSNYKPSAQIY